MRKRIVAGNWKMNNTIEEGLSLTSEIVNMVTSEVKTDVKIILAPPFIHLNAVSKLVQGSGNIEVSSQNCHQEESGAYTYTGELSAAMIKSAGAKYVIIGHSERREHYGESDQLLASKIDAVLSQDLIPIFCCGESLQIRESGNHESYVSDQIKNSLFHLSADQFRKIVIAYEPIWAIGTGVTASSGQAQEMHAAIRSYLGEKYGEDLANDCSILYGGSCKPSNAAELFEMKDVDGGLIGGASLKSRDFVDIITAFPA